VSSMLWDARCARWCCFDGRRPAGGHCYDAELQSGLSQALRSATATNVTCQDELRIDCGSDPRSKLSFRKMEPIRSFDQRSLGWTESRVLLEHALECNKDVSSNDMLEDHERLRQRLSAFGLELDRQKGDGNCQFRSIAKQLHGDPGRHRLVRQKACDYILSVEGRRRFANYLGSEGLRDYVKSMRKDGTWGDELTLRAVAESHHVMISVITSSRSNWFIRYIPDGELAENAEVFLAYLAPCHYDHIVRRSGSSKKGS
jgi:hypothetical protein